MPAEVTFEVVQVGRQATHGTAVAATTRLAVAPGAIVSLDRAYDSPDEDYGGISRHRPGRGNYGVRASEIPLNGKLTFEQVMWFLEAHLAGNVTPTVATVAISSSSVANPSVITTGSAHGLQTGMSTTIAGHSGSTPSINGEHVVTVLTATTFTIPVNVTVGGTGGTATTTQTRVYAGDETTDTLRRLTIEAGTTDNVLNQWRIIDALINELTVSFDALSSPGNSPWEVQATAIGKDRTNTAFTASLSVPTLLETAEGHLTQLYEGTTATAFASLAELADSLISFELRSNLNLKRRVRGSASGDTFTVYGRGKRETQVRAMVAIGTTADADIHDIFNAAGSVAQERRWRTKINGSNSKVITFDYRPRFTALPIEDNDGEQVYSVEADGVHDTTLASDIQATVVNGVPTI